LGGGRFNRLLGLVVVAVAVIGGVALALGVQSSGTSQGSDSQKIIDDPSAAARTKGEVEDLAAHGLMPHAPPSAMEPEPVMPNAQQHLPPQAQKAASRYEQWATEKYMKALEAPEMVQAFHGGGALEIAGAKSQRADSFASETQPDPGTSVFPNTSSMNLPQMPGIDQSGYVGFSDQVNNHYLATFGTAAVMSLISAGQMVGQMGVFGGGGMYGPSGYYQPNQWAMAGEAAGSGASGQFGGLGQQMIGNGMTRPPTLEIRPGYQFDVMITQDLVFPGPYGQ
jgi:type IV secretory pathway VirB10-like protein